MRGLALKALYGFLDAASCWNEEVGTMLVENGFGVGKANPALLHHETEDIIGWFMAMTLSRWPMMGDRTSVKPALRSDTSIVRKGD